MAQLTRNSYFKNLLADEVFSGDPFKIESDYNTLKVSIQTDTSGVLSIFQSIDGQTYQTFNDVFNITETTHKQVHIKGRYVYVKYENGGDATTNFALYSVLSKTTAASSGVGLQEVLVTNEYLDVSGAVSVNGLLFDGSGNLKVSGISGSGVSSDVNVLNFPATQAVSDASSHELLADLSGAVWENTDRMLYDLDIIANNGIDASSNAIAGNLKLDEIHTRLHDISGSVSVSNQITGFSTSAKQDSILSDLDSILNRLHDVCGNVTISNQISGFATESTLSTLSTTAEDISLQMLVPQRSWVEVDFDTQSSQLVQGAGTWRVPLTGEQGWEYVNTTIGGATAYFYTNTALVSGGLESNITLGSLTTMWFIGNYRLATAVNPNRRFYLSVYTKPQGAGDYEIWYRSSKTYQLPNSAVVSKGADTFYYAGLDISTIYKEYDHTAYELAVSRGPCADNEVIQFMALQVDSATPANNFNGIIKHSGFSTAGGTNRVVSFTRASREKIAEDNLKALTVQSGELKVKDASAVALLAEIANGITVQVGQVEISGVVITEISGVPVVEISGNVDCNVSFPSVQVVEVSGSVLTDLSGATFTESKLNVFDASASSHLSVIEEILENGFVNVYDASCELLLSGIKSQTDKLAFQNEGTYDTLRVRVENPSSGGGIVEISGVSLVDGKLPMFDASANDRISKLSFYADGYGDYDLRTQITNSVGVSVNNQPTVSLAAASVIGIDSMSNTVQLASGTSVALAPFSEVGLTSGTTVGLSFGTEVGVNNFPAKQSVFVENTADGFDIDVNVKNASIAITTASALDVDIQNSSLDAHIYGSHDGTTFHHILTTPQGKILVNSSTQDGDGNNITSTDGGTYRALDVKTQGTTTVSGSVSATASANQYGSYGNVANNITLSSSTGTAGIDVSSWSYFIGYYEDTTSPTPVGAIRVQYSFDNVTWYNLFNTQIFPSGSPRTATISKTDIPGINYLRLYNNTTSSLTGVVLTVMGGSLS